jgi:hypothetical protein
MYGLALLAVIVVVLVGTAWSPIFAVIIAVPAFIAFLAYAGFRRRADEGAASAPQVPNTTPDKASERAGMWGEKEA